MEIGFIGLGSQGAPMARMIGRAGFPLHLWARRRASLEPFEDSGARFAADPAELAAACDLVCLCVRDDADVIGVARDGGLIAALRRGAVLVVHSTVHPDTCRELEAEAAPRGIDVLDAPVSGGPGPALEGSLTVMVGGRREAFERCLPVFRSYGDPVVHLGPLGSGQLCKLINNALFTANLKLTSDGLSLAESLGLDGSAFVELVQRSSGASFALGAAHAFRAAEGTDQGRRSRALANVVKDARILETLCDAAGEPISDLRETLRRAAAWIDNDD